MISSAQQRAPSQRGMRRHSTSGTSAIADQTSRLARWLGWRRLPTARPGQARDCAMKLPSASCGM